MKKRKYADGGMADDSMDQLAAGVNEMYAKPAEALSEAKAPSFKEAFASARAAGVKTFMWNGKKYTTELASAPKAPNYGNEGRNASRPAADPNYGNEGRNRPARKSQVDMSGVDPKTLLPKKYAKGGSVKGWGMARGARKAKIV